MEYLTLFFAGIHPAYIVFIPAVLFAFAIGGLFIDNKRRRVQRRLEDVTREE